VSSRADLAVAQIGAMRRELSDPRERLIVALDVSSAKAAHEIVVALGDSVRTFKVGKQLFTAEGPQIVRDLIASRRKVFLDLKYHDIPNTVAAAVREAAKLHATMITVHASGGGAMLRAAVDAAQEVGSDLKILAVTVLTSLTDFDLEKMGIRGRVIDEVMRLGAMALANGCHGLVASALEAPELRSELGHDFLIVTPGVRPAGSGHGDQARVVTPGEAIAAGADYIVVGRPITEAADPAAEARAILGQISF
jgi:orotidine-5'-phosphate decarboxylase